MSERENRSYLLKYRHVYDEQNTDLIRRAAQETGLRFNILRESGQTYFVNRRRYLVPEGHSRIEIRAFDHDHLTKFWIEYYRMEYKLRNSNEE
jgi:hypothetical protein